MLPCLSDRHVTTAMKGSALILMLVHHFFTFPEWYINGVGYANMELFASVFNSPTKICVPIFAFLTGYFMFWKEPSVRYSFKKATDILISYWIFLLPFLLIAVLLGTYTVQLDKLFLEALGFRRDIMYFCWYIPFYCVSMFLLPVVARFLTHSLLLDICIALFIQVVFAVCSQAVPNVYVSDLLEGLYAWFPSVLIGYLAAKYALLDKIDTDIVGRPARWLTVPICLMLMVIPFLLRAVTFEISFGGAFSQSVSEFVDELIFIFFIYGLSRLLFLIRKTWFHRILEKIGAVSMEMWFAHCIFFNASKEYTQGILYAPQNPILVLAWGGLMCYMIAKLVEPAKREILKQKNRILKLDF